MAKKENVIIVNNCLTCVYWHRERTIGPMMGSPLASKTAAPIASCRRYPPLASTQPGGTADQHAETSADDWCGEFEQVKK